MTTICISINGGPLQPLTTLTPEEHQRVADERGPLTLWVQGLIEIDLEAICPEGTPAGEMPPVTTAEDFLSNPPLKYSGEDLLEMVYDLVPSLRPRNPFALVHRDDHWNWSLEVWKILHFVDQSLGYQYTLLEGRLEDEYMALGYRMSAGIQA